MLAALRISQYALIEEVEIEFGPGLNVLTGETGAGKSILVDSMALLLGARARTEMIREGFERATIEGFFADDKGERVMRREVVRDSTNRCWLDGRLATAAMLKDEGERWVDLHGQHEDRLLVRASVQRDLLDAYAGARDLAGQVARAATELADLERERRSTEEEGSEREARLAYFRSQVAEIDAAKIAAGEDDALAAEAALLHNSAERARLAAEAHLMLEGADESVAAVLASLQRKLDRLADLDPALNRVPERLTSARYEIEDLARELGRYSEGVEQDPGRLAAVEARRDLLERLKRKHGSMLEDVLEQARAMSEEVVLLETRAARGAELEREEAHLRKHLSDLAGRLADAREAAADRLEAAVGGRLAELGMGDGTFEVDLSRRTDPAGVEWSGERYAWTRGGLESVAFRISPNAGEAPHPLSQIASGGELSRVLLALKAALAEVDRTPTLIFDEIDAGIGGVMAHQVARQLAAVASHHQVIVVTHLAQIAAVSERHLVVEKKPAGGRTVTGVRRVTGEERVRELSRLLGGDPERKVSRHHARELLKGRV